MGYLKVGARAFRPIFSLVSVLAGSLSGLPAHAQISAAAITGSANEDNSESGYASLQEIVVTAAKRRELLQDVPMSVTALSAQSLLDENITTLRDVYSQIPGLSYQGGSGQNTLSLNGVSMGSFSPSPTVAVTIDDIPFGANSAAAHGSTLQPDIDPSILSGIEVLRGPQGTLYGANSLGGLLKYETVTPSTTAMAGRVEIGDQIVASDATGYQMRGAVGLPLIDGKMALQVSGFYRDDPGFIDNTLLNIKNFNSDHADGGYAALVFEPVSQMTIKLFVLEQHLSGQGGPNVMLGANLQPLTGDLQEGVTNSPYYTNDTLYGARVMADVGFAELTSVTGYGDNKYYTLNDATATFGFLLPVFGLPPTDVVPATTDYDTKKITQELRLSSKESNPFEWLVGAFYDHESNSGEQLVAAENPTTGAIDGTLISADEPSRFEEEALFASLTYHFDEAFDTQIGGRYGHTFQSYVPTGGGFLIGPTRTEQSSATDNSATWQFTPRYHFTKDLMSYLRIATGFRPGGANVPTSGSPPTYGPDKTVDYELGLKATLLQNRLTLDGSLFWIDWRNPQITETDAATQTSFFGNASGARSRGVNLSSAFIPWQGMTFAWNGAFTDAVLTQALPPDAQAYAPAGERLPYAARFTSYLSAEQRYQTGLDLDPFIALGVTYVGQRYSEFAANAAVPRFSLPSYTTLDLRGGLYFGRWTFTAIARNLTDRRGWLSGGLNVSTQPSLGSTVSVIQPRTYGLSVAYRW